MKKQVKFNLNKQSGNARTGLLQVGEKQVTTPALVQTGDTITTLTPGELTKLGTTAIKQSVLPYWRPSYTATVARTGSWRYRC